ncbi:MAG: hypothetical protein AAF318_14285 [Pseudomonadota bacterium]
MRKTLIALAALFVAAPALAQEQPASTVARAILSGYVERDVAAIAAHSNDYNQRFFSRALQSAEFAAQLWDGTRGEAGTGWDGNTLPARYRPGRDGLPEAIVPFAVETKSGVAALGDGKRGRYIVVVLTLDSADDTTWGFEDFNFLPPSKYEGYFRALP